MNFAKRGAPCHEPRLPAFASTATLLLTLLTSTSCSPGGESESTPPFLETPSAALSEGRIEDAFRLLVKVCADHPDSPQAHRLLAQTCLRAGRTRRGVRAITRALELNDADPEAHRISARLDDSRFHPVDAIASARRALHLDPVHLEGHLLLGRLLLGAADNEGAVVAFRRAHELAPESSPALRGLARSLVLAGHQDEGDPLVEEYLRKHPRDGELVHLRGLSRMRGGDFDGAEEDFRATIRMQPHIPSAHYNLARILRQSERTEEAERVLATFHVVNKRDREIRILQRVLLGRPDDISVARKLARLLEKAKRTEEAARAAARVRELRREAEEQSRG
ncbi:MAG: hypothetical protein CME07_04465 [Gemmatimonadetes bacterium]|nr:hypothetical protein [Gemmatimonadota bacterium]